MENISCVKRRNFIFKTNDSCNKTRIYIDIRGKAKDGEHFQSSLVAKMTAARLLK